MNKELKEILYYTAAAISLILIAGFIGEYFWEIVSIEINLDGFSAGMLAIVLVSIAIEALRDLYWYIGHLVSAYKKGNIDENS